LLQKNAARVLLAGQQHLFFIIHSQKKMLLPCSVLPGALKISSGYGIVGEYSEKEAGHGSGKKPA
jgi:hypothetical protein